MPARQRAIARVQTNVYLTWSWTKEDQILFALPYKSTMDQILFALLDNSIRSTCSMRIMITLLLAFRAVILQLFLILLSAWIWSSQCPPGPIYVVNYGHVCRRAMMQNYEIYEIPLAEAEVILSILSVNCLLYLFRSEFNCWSKWKPKAQLWCVRSDRSSSAM